METTMNNIRPDTSNPTDDARQHGTASRPARRPGDDVVRWSEFRQAQWIGGIALVAILGSQGFLYSAIMDLQREMHTQIGSLRTEMQAQFADVQDQFTDLRERVHELSERVTRIETRLDMAAGPADKPGN